MRAESILVQFGRKGLTDRLTDAGVRSAVDQTLVIACGPDAKLDDDKDFVEIMEEGKSAIVHLESGMEAKVRAHLQGQPDRMITVSIDPCKGAAARTR